MKRFLRIGLLMALLPCVAEAAGVFVQYPGGAGIMRDPLLATQSGAGFFAEADLLIGEFKAVSNSPDANFAYAGIDNQLILTNPAGAPGAVAIPAGAFTVNVTGVYALGPGAAVRASSAGAGITAVLSVTHGATQHVASGSHGISQSWVDGVPGTPGNTTSTNNSGGGSVVFNTTTLSNLDMTLSMPAFLLNPGDSLAITFLLQAITGANGLGVGALADAGNTARFSLLLQAGDSLASNAGGELSWVTTVPVPGALPLLSTALAAVGWRMRRRRDGRRCAA